MNDKPPGRLSSERGGDTASGEIAAALRASQDLGPDYDEAISASLAEHLDAAIEERVRAHVAEHSANLAKKRESGINAQMAFAIGSLFMALPLSGIAATQAGALGLVVVWVGIVLLNLAVALRRR